MEFFLTPARRAVAVALFALTAVACSDKAPTDPAQAARAAIAKGELREATVQLKSAIQSAPQSGEFRYLMGLVLLGQGDSSGAIVELRKAEELGGAPDAVTAALARALAAAGRYKEVVDAYAGTTLADAPAQAELQTALAAAWLGLRSADKAALAAAKAVAAVPDFGPALLIESRIAASNKQLDEALALADRAAARGPRAGEAQLYRAWLLLRGKRDPLAAVAAFEAAAKDKETELAARVWLVQLQVQAKNLAQAKEQVSRLQQAFPNHPSTVFAAAVLAFAEKDYVKAGALAESLLKLAPGSAPLLVLSGAAHLRQGELASAESKLGRVVQTNEDVPDARRLLGETYLRTGQPDKALAALEPLIERRTDAEALMLGAQARLQKNDAGGAEDLFELAAKLKPDDVQVQTSLALMDLGKGKPEAAFSALQQLADRDSGTTADMALISAHLRRGEHQAALEAIARLEKKLPGKPMPLHVRGIALLGKGDMDAARQAFAAALAADPGYYAATAGLVSLDMAQGKAEEAQRMLEAVLVKTPTNAAARMALIDVLRSRGAAPDVIERAIDAAVRQSPTEPDPYLAKIAHVARIRGPKEAAGEAQIALAALPNNPQILDAAGLALAAAADQQQAIVVFNRLASAAPRTTLPYLRLAELYSRRGMRAETATMLDRAFEVAPESTEVHRAMLAHATRTKDYKPVLIAAKALQKKAPQAAAGFLLEGAAEASRKAWPAALTAYQSALDKPGTPGEAERSYYATLKRAGQTQKAERFAAEWLSQHPKDVHLRGLLGSDALAAGRKADAERYFREIVEIAPRSLPALNNLAWLLAERGDEAALSIAERAYALAPAQPEIIDTYAKTLESSGQLDRAIALQRSAVHVRPDRSAYRLSLARMLVKAGDKPAARRELDQLGAPAVGEVDQAELAALRSALAR
ncbi:MAG: hypothetical protein AMXMBFR78_03520 [Rubrivivax sp.]